MGRFFEGLGERGCFPSTEGLPRNRTRSLERGGKEKTCFEKKGLVFLNTLWGAFKRKNVPVTKEANFKKELRKVWSSSKGKRGGSSFVDGRGKRASVALNEEGKTEGGDDDINEGEEGFLTEEIRLPVLKNRIRKRAESRAPGGNGGKE